MAELVIRNLSARVERTHTEVRGEGVDIETDSGDILRGVDLDIGSGEVHAVMGPNGAGKSTLSHVLAGKPGYVVTGGSATLDGFELLDAEPWQRAQAGLFLAMQYPTEVPGVGLNDVLDASFRAAGRSTDDLDGRIRTEADRLGIDPSSLARALNVDFSGGEKKRSETLQLSMLEPKIAILDEIDSGLDVDALRTVSRRVEAETNDRGLGVLVITHYARLLTELKPDRVHVLAGGRIVRSGGPELADELESTGYGDYVADEPAPAASTGGLDDLFAM